MTKIQKEDKRC